MAELESLDHQMLPTVSIIRRRFVIGGLRNVDAFLVVGVTLLVTAAPLLPRKAAMVAASGIAMLAALAWYKRCVAAAPYLISCVVCLGLVVSGVRYFQVVLVFGLAAYAAVVCVVPWLRGTATWARCGSFDATVRFLCLCAWLLAAAALLSWYLLLHPNIRDLVKVFVPTLPLGVLIVGGLLFSMVNAAVEEGAYRGVILHALDSSVGAGFASLLLQAIAFGAIHIRGFPRGFLGVGLACIYGLFMGVIRRRAGGMFAPWLAHVFTDVVIAGIVLFLARPEAMQPPRPAVSTAESSYNLRLAVARSLDPRSKLPASLVRLAGTRALPPYWFPTMGAGS